MIEIPVIGKICPGGAKQTLNGKACYVRPKIEDPAHKDPCKQDADRVCQGKGGYLGAGDRGDAVLGDVKRLIHTAVCKIQCSVYEYHCPVASAEKNMIKIAGEIEIPHYCENACYGGNIKKLDYPQLESVHERIMRIFLAVHDKRGTPPLCGRQITPAVY